MFSEEKARKIAEDFLSKANPTNWDGVGEQPKELDTRIITYDIDSKNDNELDISFEYLDKDAFPDDPGWTHYCELRDKETGNLMTDRGKRVGVTRRPAEKLPGLNLRCRQMWVKAARPMAALKDAMP